MDDRKVRPWRNTSDRTTSESLSPVTHHLRLLHNGHSGPTTIVWVPGYKGIHDSKLAGTVAKAATTATSDPPRPTSSVEHSPTQHLLIRGQRRCTVDSLGLKIADAVLLARLRVGYTP